MAYNKLVVVMGGVSWKGGSWEVTKPTTTAWLKMEDACILCNVIEIFWQGKWPMSKDEGILTLWSSKWHWHNCVKTYQHVYVSKQIFQLLRGGIDQWVVGCDSSFSLAWVKSKATNPWVTQDRRNKSTQVWSTMTTLIKVWMPSLVNTMSIHWREELNVVKKSSCNCFHPTWKLASRAMAPKVSQIASWVLMRSLSWTQRKKWILVGSMRCVHTDQRMFTIKGWGSLSRVQNVVEKTGENNWKVRKTSWIVSQKPTPRPKPQACACLLPFEQLIEQINCWSKGNLLLSTCAKALQL